MRSDFCRELLAATRAPVDWIPDGARADTWSLSAPSSNSISSSPKRVMTMFGPFHDAPHRKAIGPPGADTEFDDVAALERRSSILTPRANFYISTAKLRFTARVLEPPTANSAATASGPVLSSRSYALLGHVP